MPKVESYAQGTPCWVDLTSSDVEGAKSFYSSLFGWNIEEMPAPEGMTYSMASLKGSYVAGMMAQMPEQTQAGVPSMWNTYIAVDSADDAEKKMTEAGGKPMFPTDEIPGSGRMVMGTDPSGAVVGFWQGTGHIGSGLVNEPGTVVWNELQVDDVDAVLPFYKAVAGMDSETAPAGDMGDYTQFMVGGKGIAGAMKKPMPDIPNNWTIYFNVGDADTAIAKAQELGGQVIAPAFDVPGIGRLAVLADPQGATFCLMSAGGTGGDAAGSAGAAQA